MNKITKEQFCEYIARMKNAWDYDMEVTKLTRERNMEFGETNASYLVPTCVELLDKLMGDTGDVEYFCIDIDFGRDYKPGCVQELDGTDVDFSTAEKLYDYLATKG